ncbi:MAG: glutathione S-transferase C-terminal domain-containing protein [Formosimonas sp.]|jgi:glutathione S-transferase
MKLIGAQPSPFTRKIRILLTEKSLPFEFILDAPWEATNLIDAHNPLGQVPCLILNNGYTVYDSRVIEDFLEDIAPMHIPSDVTMRLAVKKWAALADGMLDAGVKIRVETAMRPADKQHQPWIDRQTAKIMRGLDLMETHLTHHLWCANNMYSLADVSTVCMLGFLDYRLPTLEWRESHPHVAKLANYLNEQTVFAETLPYDA